MMETGRYGTINELAAAETINSPYVSRLLRLRNGATGHWQGARDQATLWAISNGGDEDAATVHGTHLLLLRALARLARPLRWRRCSAPGAKATWRSSPWALASRSWRR